MIAARPRRRRSGAALAALVAFIVAATAAAPAYAQPFRACGKPGAVSGTVTLERDRLAYRLTVQAPDACYRPTDTRVVTVRATRAAVQLGLTRPQGALCAQVITPVIFEGAVVVPRTLERIAFAIDGVRRDRRLKARFATTC